MTKKVYQELATAVTARRNCIERNNGEWLGRWENHIAAIVEAHLPSGGGFDCGAKLDLDESTAEKLVLTTEFHHMNDGGMYDGWTGHRVIVTPSLQFGFSLRIAGRDRSQIKEYMHDVFQSALSEDCALTP